MRFSSIRLVANFVTSFMMNDAAGSTVAQIQYDDWQKIARVRGETGISYFPKRIVVIQFGQDLQLEMKTISIMANTPISAQRFGLMPPREISVTPLSPTQPVMGRKDFNHVFD